MKGKAILLGGSGFVGKHLQPLLNDNNIEYTSLSSQDIDLCDVQCVDKLAQTYGEDDTIVFLSCLTPRMGRDPETLQRNIAMANNLYKALEKKPCSHVIYISSDAVYDDNLLIDEETPVAPRELYSTMHITRELIMKEAEKNLKIPLTILRPVPMYGATSPHNSYGPIRFGKMAVEKSKITLFGGGEEMRDHLYVGDFAEILRRAIQEKKTGLLNAAYGQSMSFVDVARQVAGLYEKNVEVELTPRQNPITHRHYNTTRLFQAFPDLKLTDYQTGFRMLIDGLNRL